MATVKVKIAERNRFGVLDHEVTGVSGAEFYNPMRIFPNNGGSEDQAEWRSNPAYRLRP